MFASSASKIYSFTDLSGSGSLSGSLSLSVWALPQPYQGGAFSGVLLGRQALGQLPGLEALGEQAMTAVLPHRTPPKK